MKLPVDVDCLPVDKPLLDRYLLALDAINDYFHHDKLWHDACQAALVVEIALFESLGFEPRAMRGDVLRPPIAGPVGPLRTGARMTYADSRVWRLLGHPQGYARAGGWTYASGLFTGWSMCQLADPAQGTWTVSAEIEAPSYSDEELERVLAQLDRAAADGSDSKCLFCDEKTELETDIGGQTLELCHRHAAEVSLAAFYAQGGLRGREDGRGRRQLDGRRTRMFAAIEELVAEAGLAPSQVRAWYERLVAAGRHRTERELATGGKEASCRS